MSDSNPTHESEHVRKGNRRPSAERPIKVRLRDVAKSAGVSLATASMALSNHPDVSEQTKARVREIGRRLGYNRASQGAPAIRFGVLFASGGVHLDVNAELISAISAIGLRAGIRIEFGGTDMRPTAPDPIQQAMDFCQSLDGVLLCGPVTDELLLQLRSLQIPHIMLGGRPGPLCAPREPSVTTITFDDIGMGYYATRWLIQQKHRRIAFICETIPPGLQHDRWYRGYQLALLEAGFPLDPALLFCTGIPESGAEPIVPGLLALPSLPTAYLVPDTRIAATLITSLRERSIRIDPASLVFGGTEPVIRSTGMSEYPHLTGRIDLMADQGINQLLRLREGLSNGPVEVVVPFDTHQLG